MKSEKQGIPTKTWYLRWSPKQEASPTFCHGESGERLSLYTSPNGSRCLVDGYLFDTPRHDLTWAESAWHHYQQQGEKVFNGLRGGFVLALWDASRSQLLLGRDATGLRTCFYVWKDNTFWVSSCIDTLVRLPEISNQRNRIRIAEGLLHSCNFHQWQETYYQDVLRLPPAHQLTLASSGLSMNRYWDPVPPGFSWATAEERAQLPNLLEQSVQRCLDVGGDSVALSGGFDSVSIATLATQSDTLTQPLWALSLRFSGKLCDEGVSQQAVAQALGMPQVLYTMEEGLDNANYVAASLAQSSTSPNPVLSVWQSMFGGLLKMGQERKLSNLMMGTGGDDIFIVDPAHGQDLLSSFQWFQLWKYVRMWQRSSPFGTLHMARFLLWSQALRPTLKSAFKRLFPGSPLQEPRTWWRARKGLHFPDWLHPQTNEIQEALLYRRECPPAHAQPYERDKAYSTVLAKIPQSPMLFEELDQAMAWGQQFGFTLLYPYFDQDLFGLALRMHPRYLMEGGWSKSPLRQLVAQKLPNVPLHKQKVDFTQMMHQVLRGHGASVWEHMRELPMMRSLQLIQLDPLVRFIDDYFLERHQHFSPVWATLGLESWLQERSNAGL